jgi:membrane-bound lytic murein transglycosylase D
MLLASGRPRAAAAAATELLSRLKLEGFASPTEGDSLVTAALALMAFSQVAAECAIAAPHDSTAPPAPPWWTGRDEGRPEVERWREHFRGDGARTVDRWLRQAAPYRADVLGVLREEGLPPELWVLTLLESGLDPSARSPSNAVGPWQFASPTARYLGLLITADRDQRRDWEIATRAACRYLGELKRDLGSGLLALAAYNCGPGCLRRAAAGRDSVDFWALDLPAETTHYVPRAVALASLVGDGEDAMRNLPAAEPPLDYEVVSLPHPVRVADLATVCEAPAESLRVLNPAWLREVTPADGHEVNARVPRGSAGRVRDSLERGALTRPQTSAVAPASSTHRVKAGETLWGIAKRYGVSVAALRRANGLGKSSHLRIGQRLKISS